MTVSSITPAVKRLLVATCCRVLCIPANRVRSLSPALGPPPGQNASIPGLDGDGCKDNNMYNE